MAKLVGTFALFAMFQLTASAEVKYSTGVASNGALMTDSNSTQALNHLMRRFEHRVAGLLDEDPSDSEDRLQFPPLRIDPATGAFLNPEALLELPTDIGYLAPGCATGSGQTANFNNNWGIYPVAKTATSITINAGTVEARVRCCSLTSTECTYSNTANNVNAGKGCYVGDSSSSWDNVGTGKYVRCTDSVNKYLQRTSGTCLGDSQAKTYSEALSLCQGLGDDFTLCTYQQAVEIQKPSQSNAALCCSTGCGYDFNYIWLLEAPKPYFTNQTSVAR